MVPVCLYGEHTTAQAHLLSKVHFLHFLPDLKLKVLTGVDKIYWTCKIFYIDTCSWSGPGHWHDSSQRILQRHNTRVLYS